jgi:hypothetical protein
MDRVDSGLDPGVIFTLPKRRISWKYYQSSMKTRAIEYDYFYMSVNNAVKLSVPHQAPHHLNLLKTSVKPVLL